MEPDRKILDEIRSFNRYYTNVIGLLDQHFLDSPFSLTEGRVLYEISHLEGCTAKKIRENIIIDEGYLSRIIDKFIQRGLVERTRFPKDRRLHLVVLTESGRKEFSKLNDNSDRLISQVIGKLSGAERAELVDKMRRIRELLDKNEQG